MAGAFALAGGRTGPPGQPGAASARRRSIPGTRSASDPRRRGTSANTSTMAIICARTCSRFSGSWLIESRSSVPMAVSMPGTSRSRGPSKASLSRCMRATAFSNSGVIARIGISMSSTSLFSRVASCSMPFAARCSAAIASNIPPTVLRAFSATPITPLTMFIGPLNRLITSKSGRSSVATGTTLGAGRCGMPGAGGHGPARGCRLSLSSKGQFTVSATTDPRSATVLPRFPRRCPAIATGPASAPTGRCHGR